MDCRVCGRQFDPQGFQVMVPGLPHGFDRVDCALEAHALGVPPAPTVEPAAAVVMRALPTPLAAVPAFAAGPVMVRAQNDRPQFLVGANLALLAAGTAATIYLWLRVFGADAGPISFPAANASDAFARSTVAAAIDLSPAPEARPQPESTVRGGGSSARDVARQPRSRRRRRRNARLQPGPGEAAALEPAHRWPRRAARGAPASARPRPASRARPDQIRTDAHHPGAVGASRRPHPRPDASRRLESRAARAARRRHPRLAVPARPTAGRVDNR